MDPISATPDLSPSQPRRALLAGIGGLAAGAFLASTAHAGPLTPPPGPIQSTPGPEPRIPINAVTAPGNDNYLNVISQPGSYYLTGNIDGVPNKGGISITVPNVTLDLMGFRVRRSEFVTPQSGIVSFVNAANITIRNGSVVDWGLNGISLNGKGNLIENVHTSGNGTSGILIGSVGSQSIVRNCSAADNAKDGIDIGYYGMALDCVSNSNGRNGVSGSVSAVVARCAVTGNGNNGINIFDEGFSTSEGALVIDSLARSNFNHGISVKGGVTVRGNQCLQNSLNDQAGSGIRVTGSYCMVTDNNCIRNGTGVLVTGSTNFIARNACSSNSRNWSIVAGNSFLIVETTRTASNFNGNAGGGGVGSTNPHANFTY